MHLVDTTTFKPAARGFVAPAWLLSVGSRGALRRFPLIYATSLRNFYLAPQIQALLSSSLVFSARNATGRWLACLRKKVLPHEHESLPLIRFNPHPKDALYPAQLRHCQSLL